MKTYRVFITETIVRKYDFEADNAEEAEAAYFQAIEKLEESNYVNDECRLQDRLDVVEL